MATNQKAYQITLFLSIIHLVIIASVACSFCGELPENLKSKIDIANTHFGKFVELEPIPCEMRYFNVNLKTEKCDTLMINDLHELLYDSEKHDGWITLLVHDASGKYLFSHGKNGNIYKQSGD